MTMKKDELNKELQKDADSSGPGRMAARFSNRERPTSIAGTLKRLLTYTGAYIWWFVLVFILVLSVAGR